MSAASRLQYLYYAYLAKPKAERHLYRALRLKKRVRLVELGLGTLTRTERLIRVAQRYAGDERIEYTGFDLFDARPESATPLALIVAHRRLKATGARVRLVPGDPGQSLPGVANNLPGTDLLLISSDLDQASMAPAWCFLPRMLSPEALLLQMPGEQDGDSALVQLSLRDIEQRAHGNRRRAA